TYGEPARRSSGGLEHALDHVAGGSIDGGACAASDTGRPQHLTAGRQDRDARASLARHLGVDQDVLQLPRADPGDAQAVTRRQREHALDVRGRWIPARAALEPRPHDAAGKRRGLGGDVDVEAVAGGEAGGAGRRRGSEEVVLVTQPQGKGRQRGPETWVELGG